MDFIKKVDINEAEEINGSVSTIILDDIFNVLLNDGIVNGGSKLAHKVSHEYEDMSDTEFADMIELYGISMEHCSSRADAIEQIMALRLYPDRCCDSEKLISSVKKVFVEFLETIDPEHKFIEVCGTEPKPFYSLKHYDNNGDLLDGFEQEVVIQDIKGLSNKIVTMGVEKKSYEMNAFDVYAGSGMVRFVARQMADLAEKTSGLESLQELENVRVEIAKSCFDWEEWEE